MGSQNRQSFSIFPGDGFGFTSAVGHRLFVAPRQHVRNLEHAHEDVFIRRFGRTALLPDTELGPLLSLRLRERHGADVQLARTEPLNEFAAVPEHVREAARVYADREKRSTPRQIRFRDPTSVGGGALRLGAMRFHLDGTTIVGTALDLRDVDSSIVGAEGDLSRLRAAIDDPADPLVECAPPGDVHRQLGIVREGMTFDRRQALIDAARSNGLTPPQPEMIANLSARRG